MRYVRMEATIELDSSTFLGNETFEDKLRRTEFEFSSDTGIKIPTRICSVKTVSISSIHYEAYEITDIYQEKYGISIKEWEDACAAILHRIKEELSIKKNITVRFVEGEYEEYTV